jgi:small subunit ribosomal protein S6
MRHFETIYILKPDLAEEECKEAVSKFTRITEKNNGEIIRIDEWGPRVLAYQLKKYNKGYYVFSEYCGEPGLTQELERELKLDDRVLKYMTVKLGDKVDVEALKAQVRQKVEKQDEEMESRDPSSQDEPQEQEEEHEVKNGAA